MIKVKATRESAQKPKTTRENYELQEPKKSSVLPLSFLLFLTGCAVYLKSFLPVGLELGKASAEPKQQPEGDEDQQAPAGDHVRAEAEPEEVTTGSVEDSANSSDNVIPLRLPPQAIRDFLANDSPALDFSASRRQPWARSETGSGSSPARPTNDNHSLSPQIPTPPKPGGGGGGGGGDSNGAGGGSSNPDPRIPTDPDLPRNRAPRTSGPIHLQDATGCHGYLISVLALLQGATDPDGDRLSLGNVVASSGTLTWTNGGWLFTPERGVFGDVTLTYYITDGEAVIRQTAYFKVVEAPPIVGTAGDDNLLGTHCADTIDGQSGNDNIDARGGDDLIMGGDGDDHIVAGVGNDIVHAGAGNDIVFGGAGNDLIFGGAGHDLLVGGHGNDIIYGEAGNDRISGGDGDDVLLAGDGHDTVEGDAGNDTLDGGDGDDNLQGGAGNDILLADAGNDVADGGAGDDVISDGTGCDSVYGGDGNDYVIAAVDAVADAYSGDDGEDTLDYSTATMSITIDLGRGRAESREVGLDLIAGFEKIIAGQGDDRIVAGTSSATFTGGDGNDTFDFGHPDESNSTELAGKITDFTVGDRIITASYEIRYRQDDDASDVIENLFDHIYLSNDDNDHRPVRLRFEKIDDDERTFVDVHRGPDSEEFYSIELSGHHRHLEIVVGVS